MQDSCMYIINRAQLQTIYMEKKRKTERGKGKKTRKRKQSKINKAKDKRWEYIVNEEEIKQTKQEIRKENKEMSGQKFIV